MKKIGVYIHIPFCKRKCYYCDFISFVSDKDIQKKYIEALKKEIKNFFENNKNIEVKTIYIGGGTPSFIDENYIKEILQELKIRKNIETTIEVNPGTVNKQKLIAYKEAGINRLSIGLQATQDRLLKQMGRIHSYQEFVNTYKMAEETGFTNINVDLIIGLPTQKILDVKDSLEKLMSIKPKHISVYSLIVEEKTKLYDMIKNGECNLPNEITERDMYWYVKNYLELNGYKHYEISNFAKNGYESKHNLDCWEQGEYIGFGLSAHSYMDRIRFSNIDDLKKYINNCNESDFKQNRIIQEKQNEFSMMQEYMLLGLRKIDGVSIQKFKNKFGENPIFLFRTELNKLSNQKLLYVDNNNIKLTNRGLDFANIVWEEFV